MAKVGRPKSERDDVTTKVDRGIYKRAMMVARARGIPVAEYISDLLRGPVNRDFAKEMRRIDSEGKGAEAGEE